MMPILSFYITIPHEFDTGNSFLALFNHSRVFIDHKRLKCVKNGQELPRKSSFSLYEVHLTSSNSLTTWNFSVTLVFFYSQLSRAMVHAVIKILKKIPCLKVDIYNPYPHNFDFSINLDSCQ